VDAPVPGFAGLRGTAVSMGNPHLVLLGQPLQDAPLLGPALERAEGFPERTNVEFVQPLMVGAEQGLEVVVWERGAGLTEACGTGACAAVAAAVHQQRLPADTFLPVRLPGGPLSIRVEKDLSRVWMRGPATFVFEATVPGWAGR
jgi:diaminopimelate epimerase